MKISDIFKRQERTFSFEFFPPKDEISAVDFGINVGQLMRLDPSFVTVTYGAGGSTQERTFALVDYINNKIGMTCMAHYTCVNATREKVEGDMKQLFDLKIHNAMLLRGDPPKGSEKFIAVDGGFKYASELIRFVKSKFDFSVGGAAYPEIHPEATDMDRDIENLKHKIDAGADFLITQMFFDNRFYYDFVKKVRDSGINCRIIPGIIPITNYNQIKRFAQLSNARIPQEIIDTMEPVQDQPDVIYKLGVEFAIKQVKDLMSNGAPGIHFYTLNKSRAAVEIFESIK